MPFETRLTVYSSNTAGIVPTGLRRGEFAWNGNDQRLYIGKDGGTTLELPIPAVGTTEGRSLRWDDTAKRWQETNLIRINETAVTIGLGGLTAPVAGGIKVAAPNLYVGNGSGQIGLNTAILDLGLGPFVNMVVSPISQAVPTAGLVIKGTFVNLTTTSGGTDRTVLGVNNTNGLELYNPADGTIRLRITMAGLLLMPNLPTAAPATSGALWRDASGFVKVVP